MKSELQRTAGSTILGLVTSLKMMMVVDVQQIVPSNEYLIIPSTPGMKGQVCCVDASCHLLDFDDLVLSFVELSMPLSLPGTLVFATMVLSACSSQDLVIETDSHTFLSHCRA